MCRTTWSIGYAPLGVLLALVLTGCGANIREHHFFATYATEDSGTPTNFFRLNVEANTSFTNARYVAGYYDERVVDLFFNELKPATPPALFPADAKDPGSDEKIRPLTPADGRGRFVMILSTNADSIANTIGALTENQAAMEALNALTNKTQIERMQRDSADAPGLKAAAAATVTQLEALASTLSDASDAAAAQATLLRMVNTLAIAAGNRTPFSSIDQAKVWFERQGVQP